jgi:hypothetical protein
MPIHSFQSIHRLGTRRWASMTRSLVLVLVLVLVLELELELE